MKNKAVLIGIVVVGISALTVRGADRGQIQSGETRTNLNISVPSPIDTWTFTGNAGDRVIINAVTTTGTLDTAIVLYPPNGGAQEATTHSQWGGGDKLDYQLKSNGLYTIVIEDDNFSATGGYNITLMKIPGTVNSAADPNGGPIASGQSLNGTIQVRADMDGFQFFGYVGDRVIINAVTTTGTLDTAIVLYPPNGGAQEATTHSQWGGGDKLNYQLKSNGLYTIVIEDDNFSATGGYNITLMKIPGTVNSAADPNGGPIASGQSLNGTIQVRADMDGFQFFGYVGDRVIINAVTTTGTLDTAIVLYPPNGGAQEATTHSQWGGGDKLDYQLKSNGLYTIVIEDSALSATGTYYISMTQIPSTLHPGLYNPSPALASVIPLSLNQLSWDPVPGATGYDLDFGEGVSMPLVQVGTNFISPTYPLPAVEADKDYYWHVVARVAGAVVDGPYWWFSVDGPSLEFNTLRRLSCGGCQLDLRGRYVGSLIIQRSADLSGWTNLTTIANVQGTLSYIDSTVTNCSGRYYRAVSP